MPITPPAVVALIWDQVAPPSGLRPWNAFPVSDIADALRRLCAIEVDILQAGLRVYVARRSTPSPVTGSSLGYCRQGLPSSHAGAAEPDGRSPLGWATLMERRR